MSAVKSLVNILLAAQEAASLSGKSVLLRDAKGSLSALGANSLILDCGNAFDLDQLLPTGFYKCGYPLAGTMPGGIAQGTLTFSMLLCWTPSDKYGIQLFLQATDVAIFVRNYINGSFSNWKRVAVS